MRAKGEGGEAGTEHTMFEISLQIQGKTVKNKYQHIGKIKTKKCIVIRFDSISPPLFTLKSFEK